jgi:lipopolysaccharide transport system permease protein
MIEDTTPTTIIDARTAPPLLDARALWQHRELFIFMVWQELNVRYKQTVLGVGWAVLQPILTMTIFSIVFGLLLNLPSSGYPYPIFLLAALIPFRYFSSALSQTSMSLVAGAHLINKVYFPRLIIPLTSLVVPLADFAIAFTVLIPGMMLFGVEPFSFRLLALPLFMVVAFLTAAAFGVWFAALNVRYRDISQVTPFLLQVWLYMTPIFYPAEIVPENLRLIIDINPLAHVVNGFRWIILDTEAPNLLAMGLSTAGVVVVLVTGLYHFSRVERTFGDII